jgi:hypothetical protein
MVQSPQHGPRTGRAGRRRQATRRLAAALLCLGMLSGCGAKSPRAYPVPESRRLGAEVEHVWDAACRVLADRGYDIQRTESAAGVIETEWRTQNADYAANVFVTKNEDRYSDCGKPGLWESYRRKHVRVTVNLAPVGKQQTEVSVRAAFRTERTSLVSQSPAPLECRSRGRLEEEIWLESQVRALSKQIQRPRRE